MIAQPPPLPRNANTFSPPSPATHSPTHKDSYNANTYSHPPPHTHSATSDLLFYSLMLIAWHSLVALLVSTHILLLHFPCQHTPQPPTCEALALAS
jgi:hypothetical protein